MKLLWHSNAPHAPTGYGQQTALFAPRLAERYELQISALYGLDGAPIVWNGIRVLPGIPGTFGNEALPLHARQFFGDPRDGLIFTLMDVWVLNPRLFADFNMACWTPVDHEPAPPKVRQFFERSGAVPVAMSEFGMRQLEDFDPLYVPHGVDSSVYRPVPRDVARDALGYEPDEFVVGMVAANKGNPSRKHFVAALEAFARFAKHRENARLYIHADLKGQWSAGVDLVKVIDALGIEDRVRGTDPYRVNFDPFGAGWMAAVFGSMDVLLSPSAGEGFGLAVLEAGACGVPSIVTDFSAQPEVAGPAGWRVGFERWWTAQNAWQALPHVSEIVEALEDCYGLSDQQRNERATQARTHAARYDVERVMADHMVPALEAAQVRLGERSEGPRLKVRAA